MAEVIGVSSGIITLLSLTLESSTALCRTIKSLKNKEKKARELRNEVEDLDAVLRTLHESIGNVAVDIDALEQPLNRCRNACNDFRTLVEHCTEHSTDQRTSIKDWLKLRYMGEDISGFKDMLAGYKSTITIALAFANIRTTKSTHDVLDEYKELIENTKYDLEAHLQDIKRRLQSTVTHGQTISEIDTAELQRMEEERDSTQQCIKICLLVSAQIEQAQPTSLRVTGSLPPDTLNSVSSLPESSLPWLIMAEAFNSAQKDFVSSKLRLQQYLHGINHQLQTTQYRVPLAQAEQTGEQKNLEEEVGSIEESLSICDRAANQENEVRMNFFEDISIGENGQQVIVSTVKDLISAKRIKAGSGSIQVLGQVSDTSLLASLAKAPSASREGI